MSDVDEDSVMSHVDAEEDTFHEGEGEDEQGQVCSLTRETIAKGLSLVQRTEKGIAYVRLDLKDKRLTDIAAISSYIHIRFLDVSNNRLTNLSPLASLNYLLWVKVDSNAVTSFRGSDFTQLRFLQWLSLVGNRLTDLDGLTGPALENLNLRGNGFKTMRSFQADSFGNLAVLELRGNKLETTDGINLPNLQRLYLAHNKIKRLEGLEKLEKLITLHLRDNQLESLDGLNSNMKCLKYLNVRGNVISDENGLQSLRLVSKSLRVVVLSDNPLAETTDTRQSLLLLVPQLDRIDKGNVSAEERAEIRKRKREKNEDRGQT